MSYRIRPSWKQGGPVFLRAKISKGLVWKREVDHLVYTRLCEEQMELSYIF